MIKTSETETERATIEACLSALERAGLIHPQRQGYLFHAPGTEWLFESTAPCYNNPAKRLC